MEERSVQKPRPREGSRRGRMVIIAWRQTGGVPMLRSLRFDSPILSLAGEETIGGRTRDGYFP